MQLMRVQMIFYFTMYQRDKLYQTVTTLVRDQFPTFQSESSGGKLSVTLSQDRLDKECETDLRAGMPSRKLAFNHHTLARMALIQNFVRVTATCKLSN